MNVSVYMYICVYVCMHVLYLYMRVYVCTSMCVAMFLISIRHVCAVEFVLFARCCVDFD